MGAIYSKLFANILAANVGLNLLMWSHAALYSTEKYFEPLGLKVIAQKGFPFIDNIIRLRVDAEESRFMDVDIYLYREHGDYAYMRWINSPVGFLSSSKQKILYYLNAL